MGVKVKYDTNQEAKAQTETKPKSLFLEVMEFLFPHLYKKKVKEDKVEMSDKEEFEKLEEKGNYMNSGDDKFKNYPSLHEISFLKSLIAGKYEGLTEDSFKKKEDKNLFREFNSLSKKEQQEKFNELTSKLNYLALQ